MLRLEVEWTDSGTINSSGWDSIENIAQRCKIGKVVTVGFLAYETEDTLYIGLSYDPDHEHFFGVQAIQKSNIIRRTTLRAR